MKHLLKILFLVPLCVACSSDTDEEDMRQDQGKFPIGFHAELGTMGQPRLEMPKQTRALASMSSLETNGFSVWGGYKGASASKKVFDGRKVTYQSPYWRYSDLEYWTYNTYHFHGIYPTPPAGSGAYTVEYDINNLQLDITGFNSSTESDLLHGRATGIDGRLAPNVNLEFEHILTNVSVQLKKHTGNANDKVTVTGVYLLGVCTKGNYTWKENDATTPSTITSGWTVDHQSASYYGKVLDQDLTTSYADFLANMLFIPQDIDPTTNPVQLIVLYDFQLSGTGETIKDNRLSIDLPALPAWDINKKIIYQAIIHANTDITFATPIVEDWGEEQAGGAIIIK